MKAKGLWIMGSIVVVLALLLGIFGCAQGTTTTQTTTTQTTTTQTTTTQTTTTQTTTTPATKTLKIGFVGWLGFVVGLDALHAIQTSIDIDNAAGGLLIGGERYNIELVYYDSKNDQATAQSAINRLIFVDGVKFIMSGSEYVDSYVAITEANKVILLSQPNTPVILSPNYHYSFDGAIGFENIVSSYGWLQGYSGAAGKKTVGLTAMDNLGGHALIGVEQHTLPVFGFQPIGDPIYYPVDATDLSAVGLKIATLNPDIWNVIGGAGSPLAVKYVYQAGYKGLKFSWANAGASLFNAFAGTDATEGLVGGAYPIEFDPPTTALAKSWKDTFIAKFGGYHGEEIQDEIEYEILRAALMQAGSLDTDKVAAVIGNGLTWEGASGSGQMVARPDIGQARTVCSVVGYPFKIIQGGNPVYIDTMALADAVKYFQQVFK